LHEQLPSVEINFLKSKYSNLIVAKFTLENIFENTPLEPLIERNAIEKSCKFYTCTAECTLF